MYIIANAGELYDIMGLGNLKKNKDVSTVYSKKIFPDPKLAIINANIDTVVQYISGMDITLDQIFASCGLSNQEAAYLNTIVTDSGNFFKSHYVATIANEYVRPIRLNSIRFIIRSLASVVPDSIAAMTVDSTDVIDPVI